MEQCIYIQPEAFDRANLQPVREILEAGLRGEKKKIAALGASVSKGEAVKKGNAFLNKMEQKWQDYFPGSTVPEFINASVSGTFSAHALFAMKNLMAKKPDLVFLDYSVNDPGQYYLQEAFEGLVHHFLENGTYVCVLLFCNERGNCTRGAMTRIAHYYHIPLLDIGSIVMGNIRENRFSWEDYASDYVHPRIEGHEFIADNILHFFQYSLEKEEKKPYVIPEEPCFDGSFWKFEKIDGITYDENQYFSVKRYCSVIVAEFFQTARQTDCKIEIYVDGEPRECLEMYWEFAWDNRMVRMILAEQKAGWHTIEVRPAGGKQNDWEQLKQFDVRFGIGCLIEE